MLAGSILQADQQLKVQTTELEHWPSVCAVIPARNEADLLPTTLRSLLLLQNYPGSPNHFSGRSKYRWYR
jgi:hypothetical protein